MPLKVQKEVGHFVVAVVGQSRHRVVLL